MGEKKSRENEALGHGAGILVGHVLTLPVLSVKIFVDEKNDTESVDPFASRVLVHLEVRLALIYLSARIKLLRFPDENLFITLREQIYEI